MYREMEEVVDGLYARLEQHEQSVKSLRKEPEINNDEYIQELQGINSQ